MIICRGTNDTNDTNGQLFTSIFRDKLSLQGARIIWKAIISKGLHEIPALLKFLVLLTLFLLESHANAFTSLSSVAGNQVWINHLTRLQQSISDSTNEPSREPVCKPTKQMDLDAVLPNNLSQINNALLSNHSNQWESLPDQLGIDDEINYLIAANDSS